MEIKLEDYLHFYIGCDVITPDGRGKLVGFPWSIVANDRVSVHFGKMVYTKNSIDGGYDKLRNYGEYLLKEQYLVPLKSYHGTDVIHLPGGVKPILRNLSDMTEEEKDILSKTYLWVQSTPVHSHLKTPTWTGESVRYLCSIGIDIFGLIPAGLAIDKTSLKN